MPATDRRRRRPTAAMLRAFGFQFYRQPGGNVLALPPEALNAYPCGFADAAQARAWARSTLP